MTDLEQLLLDLIDFAEECQSYVPDYFRDKWNLTDEATAELRQRTEAMIKLQRIPKTSAAEYLRKIKFW